MGIRITWKSVISAVILTTGIASSTSGVARADTAHDYATISKQVQEQYLTAGPAFQSYRDLYAPKSSQAELRQALSTLLGSQHDPGLHLLTLSEHDRYTARREGGYVGLGITFDPEAIGDAFVIETVQAGLTAQEAELKDGAIVVAINGKRMNSWTLTEMVAYIKDVGGTAVTLTVVGPTGEHDVTVQRDPIDDKLGIAMKLNEPRFVQRFTHDFKDLGISEGDLLVGIDGHSIAGKSWSDVRKAIDDGFLGTVMQLAVVHRDHYTHTALELPVRRVVVHTMAGNYSMSTESSGPNDDVWSKFYNYTDLGLFNFDWVGLPEEVDHALPGAFSDTSMIVDLRNAKGDDPDVAAQALSRFVQNGDLFKIRERVDGMDVISTYTMMDWQLHKWHLNPDGTRSGTLFPPPAQHYEKPVFVVINGGTSGAAAAFAYAIRAGKHGEVVGWPTARPGSLTKVVNFGLVAIRITSGQLLDLNGQPMASLLPDHLILPWFMDGLTAARWVGAGAPSMIWLDPDVLVPAISALMTLLIVLFMAWHTARQSRKAAANPKTVVAQPPLSAQPKPQKKDERAHLDKRSDSWLALGMLAFIILFFGGFIGYQGWYKELPPRGVSLHLRVTAVDDGSPLSQRQADVVKSLDSVCKGAIEFRVAKVPDNMKENPTFDAYTRPGVVIYSEWRDAAGKRLEGEYPQRLPLNFVPKREILKLIARWSHSDKKYSPEADVQCSPR